VAHDKFELAQRRVFRRSRRFGRPVEATADMIADQYLFRVLDRVLHCLQLLRNLWAWPALFYHLYDLLEMSIGRFKAFDDLRVIAVVHRGFYPPGRIATILPGGCTMERIAIDFVGCDAI
jgi:hypothetical protein